MPICPRCSGLGTYSRSGHNYGTCFACNGSGRAKEKESKSRYLQVAYPRGVKFVSDDDDDEVLDVESTSDDDYKAPAPEEHLSGTLSEVLRAKALHAPAPRPNIFDEVTSPSHEEVRHLITAAENGLQRRLEQSESRLCRRIDDEETARISADQKLLESVLAELERRAPRRIELTRQGEVVGQVEGQHPNFATLLRLATSRDVSGYVPNIWLAGPSQSGKTTAAANLAKALQLPFFYNGALSTDFQVLGYRDAGGTYHSTPFIDAVAQPSVYLFDDIDSCDTNAPLLALNGALANGLVSCPLGQIERHRDCIVIATGNTWGLGATSDYCGRIKLDAAFLARFPAKLEWGYDEAFEARICGNPSWARRVQTARKRAQEAGLKVVIGMSVSKAGAALIANGFSPDEAADLTYLASLSADQRRILQ